MGFLTTLDTLHDYAGFAFLLLRVPLGVIFLVHGMPKLRNPQMGTSAGFTSTTWMLVGLAETVGGLLVLIGLLTQIGAAMIAVVMLGALYYKIFAWHVPFTALDKMGWEFDFTLLFFAVALFLLGAGAYSVDWMVLGH